MVGVFFHLVKYGAFATFAHTALIGEYLLNDILILFGALETKINGFNATIKRN